MNKLVLVIDDSPTICVAVEVMLRRMGYDCKCYGSAEQCIQWLWSAEGCAPDLFLVDLSLPKMDGYDLIRLLHAQPIFHDIPVVIVSRRNGLIDHLKGNLVRASDYIVKPFTTDHLRSTVEKYLGVPVLV